MALPSFLLQREQPAVGNAQLLLESGHVFFQLLSSLDPLKYSASLSLGGVLGGQGSCLGHSGLWSLPVSMESLDFGLACLWCLCVLGWGQGTQLPGPQQRQPQGVMLCSAAGPGLLLGCALVSSRAGLRTPGCLILKQVCLPWCLPWCQAVCCLGSPSQGGEVRVAGAISLPLWTGGLPREPHGIPSSFPSNGRALGGWVGRWLEGPSEGQSYCRGTEQCLSPI